MNTPVAADTSFDNAAYAPDAFVASARRPWHPPAPTGMSPADLKVLKAEMRVLQAEVALMNARIERLLSRLPAADDLGAADLTPADEAAVETPDPTDDPDAEPADAPAAAPAFDQDYTIAWGDTLTALAARFGTTVEALVEANDIADPDLIIAGDSLKVPSLPTAATDDEAIADTAATNLPAAPLAPPVLPPLPIPTP